MPSPWEAKPLRALRDLLNQRWPSRDKSSDGWIGDEEHQRRDSDHNPDPVTGVVRARDVDKDGVPIRLIVAAGMLHPAMRYVIFDRRIYRAADRWRPRTYDGSNPHTGHAHLSSQRTAAADKSTAAWDLINGFQWPELRAGASGRDVKQLQALLNANGASLVLDSSFGVATDAAVKAFQTRRGLVVDGRAGPRTRGALAAQ